MQIVDYVLIENIRLALKDLAISKFGQARLLPKDNRVISNSSIVNEIVLSLHGIPYPGGRELFYMCNILLANICYKYIIGEISELELLEFYNKYRNHRKIFYYMIYRYDLQLN